MKKIVSAATICFLVLSWGTACKHESEPCFNVRIQLTATVNNATSDTAKDGSIYVTAVGAPTFTFSINNGPFQHSDTFSKLGVGTYAVVAKSAAGCLNSAEFMVGNSDPCATIAGNSPGPLYTSVKTLILNQCKPCHVNGAAAGGANFDSDCKILRGKARIKARCIDNIPTRMPPSGPLSDADKQKILDWIGAGGSYIN